MGTIQRPADDCKSMLQDVGSEAAVAQQCDPGVPKPASSACGDPNCRASTAISGHATFGRQGPDEFGYFKIPCRICAAAYEKRTGEQAWPPEE